MFIEQYRGGRMSKIKEIMSAFTKEEMESLYKETKSCYIIANGLGVSPQTIYRVMDIYEIKRSQNIGNKKHSFDEYYFESIDSEQKAYWLGFIMADGCVYRGKGNSYRLQINLKYDDLSHLNKFQQSIGSDYNIQIKEVNRHKVAQLKVNSTIMCKHLIKHGVVERKSLVCEMPSLNEDLIPHFIRGYFDGDGSIQFSVNQKVSKMFSICGGEPMLNSINNWLNLSFRKHTNKELYEIYTCNPQKMIDVHDLLYRQATIFLSRKKRSYDIVKYILESPLMK